MPRKLKYLRRVLSCVVDAKLDKAPVGSAGAAPADAGVAVIDPDSVAADEIVCAIKNNGAPRAVRLRKSANSDSASGGLGWSYVANATAVWLKHRSGTEIELLDCSNGWFRIRGPRGQTNVIFPFGGVEKQDMGKADMTGSRFVADGTQVENGGFTLKGHALASKQNGLNATLNRDGTVSVKGNVIKLKA